MQILRHSMATCSINRSTKSQLIIGIFDRYIFFVIENFNLINCTQLQVSFCYLITGLNFPTTMLQIRTSKIQKMMKW